MKKKYNSPVLKKIGSIKYKTEGTGGSEKDGQQGWSGRYTIGGAGGSTQ